MDLLRNAHEILGIHVMLSITSFLIRISENVDEELTAGDRFFKKNLMIGFKKKKAETWRLPTMTV